MRIYTVVDNVSNLLIPKKDVINQLEKLMSSNEVVVETDGQHRYWVRRIRSHAFHCIDEDGLSIEVQASDVHTVITFPHKSHINAAKVKAFTCILWDEDL